MSDDKSILGVCSESPALRDAVGAAACLTIAAAAAIGPGVAA